MDTDTVHTGDAFEVLEGLPSESVHACVTDPPYGLAFMGRDWDDFDPKEYQEWCQDWAEKVKRVLKPGAHLLAFSGNRTHHRLFSGVEDAGFEVRDTLTWHYGSGFPKGSDMARSIDKRNDGDGEYVTDGEDFDGNRYVAQGRSQNVGVNGSEYKTDDEEAKKWQGWNTQLKPATEFVVMARKPFEDATVDCVLEHGTGALNISECRVETNDDTSRTVKGGGQEYSLDGENENFSYGEDKVTGGNENGRYPANVVFGEREANRLDENVGEKPSCDPHMLSDKGGREVYSDDAPNERAVGYPDSGGPSRYFYTSKATRAERTMDGKIDNGHPTVKPQDLMEWLVKLVTRENQIVLDPFAGSGTTCKACKALQRRFIGIEKQAKWADVARVRCGLTPQDASIVREDNEQEGLEAFTDD